MRRLLVCIAVCALVGLFAFPARAAESRSYSAKGTGQFTSATDFVGEGTATHLGRYTEAGTVAFTPTDDPAVLHVAGSIVYTASNGDELHATFSGQLNGQTGAVTGTVTYVGGTGRFDDSSGSSTLTGQVSPSGALSVSVDGSISY
jgi:hypothetical protein